MADVSNLKINDCSNVEASNLREFPKLRIAGNLPIFGINFDFPNRKILEIY